MPDPRVCVIGAGPSGLTTIKTLRDAGIKNVACFEAADQIGGNWVFREEPGHASVYETTHIISSKKLSQYSDFDMHDDYPYFPSHEQILQYHQSYAAHFGVADGVRLNTRVDTAEQAGDGRWLVGTSGPDGKGSHEFDQLIVCSGHHWDPFLPKYPGEFAGQQLHAHDYRKASAFRNKRVLVVGAGSSACDIACALSSVAAATTISIRTPQYIFPKMVLGRPIDQTFARMNSWPKWAQRFAGHLVLKMTLGSYGKYGLPEPVTGIMSMHPTLNSEIFDCLAHGALNARTGIERLDGTTVYFKDGATGKFDTIIWATGYRTSFPFLQSADLDFDPNKSLPLFKQIVPANIRNLFFIGLLQPVGCLWNLSEIQARYVAALIAGTCTLPANIHRLIERDTAKRKRQFPRGARHLAEVHHYDYMRSMRKLIGRSA